MITEHQLDAMANDGRLTNIAMWMAIEHGIDWPSLNGDQQDEWHERAIADLRAGRVTAADEGGTTATKPAARQAPAAGRRSPATRRRRSAGNRGAATRATAGARRPAGRSDSGSAGTTSRKDRT